MDCIDWGNDRVLTEILSNADMACSKSNVEETLRQFLSQLESDSESDEESTSQIFNLVLNAIDQLAHKNVDWLVCLVSILLKYGDKKSSIERLVSIASYSNLDLDTKWYLYWQLVRHFFNNRYEYEDQFRFSQLQQMYEYILTDSYRSFENRVAKINNLKVLTSDDLEETNAIKQSRQIYLVTNQILSDSHAPTRLCLDMAKSYIGMGFRVSVINLASLPSTKKSIFLDGRTFNKVADFENPSQRIRLFDGQVELSRETTGCSHIEYLDVDIPFIQLGSWDEWPDCMLSIDKSAPEIVISISDSNLFADMLAKYSGKAYPILTFPTVSDLPIQKYTIPAFRRVPSSFELDLVKANDYVVTGDHYPHRHICSEMTRKDLGIPENQYVVSIVGTRLNDEISQPLESGLIDLLSKNQDISVVFIGSVDLKLGVSFEPVEDQVFVLGHQNDLFSTISNTDFFLSPDRIGGGTGGVMALAAGLPVATIQKAYSDVSWSVGSEFSFDNYENIMEFILKCKQDPDFEEQQRQIAKAKYIAKLDANSIYRKLLEDSSIDIPDL